MEAKILNDHKLKRAASTWIQGSPHVAVNPKEWISVKCCCSLCCQCVKCLMEWNVERHTPHCHRPGWLRRVWSQEGCPGKYQSSSSHSHTPDSGHNPSASPGTTGWSGQPENMEAWQSGLPSHATLAIIQHLFGQQHFCSPYYKRSACRLTLHCQKAPLESWAVFDNFCSFMNRQ